MDKGWEVDPCIGEVSHAFYLMWSNVMKHAKEQKLSYTLEVWNWHR